ncbi:hypothetical protein Hanom_Chr12g01089671 [Helianthus anomalus]
MESSLGMMDKFKNVRVGLGMPGWDLLLIIGYGLRKYCPGQVGYKTDGSFMFGLS